MCAWCVCGAEEEAKKEYMREEEDGDMGFGLFDDYDAPAVSYSHAPRVSKRDQ